MVQRGCLPVAWSDTSRNMKPAPIASSRPRRRPDPAAGLQDFLRARQAGKPFDERAYDACLTASVAEIVRRQAQAGIDWSATASSASRSAGRNMCSNGSQVSNVAVQAGRQHVSARRRPRKIPGILASSAPATACPRAWTRSASAPSPTRAGRAPARHRQFQGRAEVDQGRGAFLPVAAPRRDPRSQERILQEREALLHAIGEASAPNTA
jgi:hypothetical protein